MQKHIIPRILGYSWKSYKTKFLILLKGMNILMFLERLWFPILSNYTTDSLRLMEKTIPSSLSTTFNSQ